MARKKIHVTADAIAVGQKYDPWLCPIALAIQEWTGDAIVAEVFRTEWRAYGRGRRYRLSRSVQRFTDRFDHHRPVQPFAFFTEVPDAG